MYSVNNDPSELDGSVVRDVSLARVNICSGLVLSYDAKDLKVNEL